MSTRFGTDFSGVRVHADREAARLSRAFGARAFTVGSHVYFGAGEYSPGHERGLHLLAHELTHVIQQEGSGARLQRRELDDPFRRRAPGDGPGLGSSTLPYREATELVECIRIMGEENREYCRAEVLGEAPPPPQARTSTPAQDEATILPDGSQRLTVGNVHVRVLPDVRGVVGVEGGDTRYELNLDPQEIEVPFELDHRGRITRFTRPDPRVTVTIQTRYGPGVDPSDPSAYGRGTTEEDIEAGRTSLRFHEGEHGRLYLDYLRTHPFPVFRGRRGMTQARFEAAVQEYLDAVEAFGDDLGAYSLERGDCVGVTIDEHRGEEPDWEPVCPGRAP